jgi:hypothetical protein
MLVVYSPFILIITIFDIWTFPICGSMPLKERDEETKEKTILVSVTDFHIYRFYCHNMIDVYGGITD